MPSESAEYSLGDIKQDSLSPHNLRVTLVGYWLMVAQAKKHCDITKWPTSHQTGFYKDGSGQKECCVVIVMCATFLCPETVRISQHRGDTYLCNLRFCILPKDILTAGAGD